MTTPSIRRRRSEVAVACRAGAARGLDDGSLTEIEIAWSDPFGHAQGKRIPAAQFLDRALGTGFAFCEASLGWNTDGEVDRLAAADQLDRRLPRRVCGSGPRRPSAVAVAAEGRPRHLRHRRARPQPVAAGSPRGPQTGAGHGLPRWVSPPRSASSSSSICSTRTARHSRTTSTPTHWRTPTRSIRCSPISTKSLSAFTRLEGIQTEYGPGQVETNLVYTDALAAADDAARLKYAAKEVARRHGKIASFMPKPFTEHSGSSQHLHISLWRDDEPAFAAGQRRRERACAARDRRPARTSAVDHIVRSAFGQRVPTLHSGLLRARHGDMEPRQPQRRCAFAGRSRPQGHPHRVAQRCLRCQSVLADRLGTGCGRRRAGGQAHCAAAHWRATSTAKACRYRNRSVWRWNSPPATTPSSRSSARTRC